MEAWLVLIAAVARGLIMVVGMTRTSRMQDRSGGGILLERP